MQGFAHEATFPIWNGFETDSFQLLMAMFFPKRVQKEDVRIAQVVDVPLESEIWTMKMDVVLQE